MRQFLAVLIGKCVYAATKLRGGGSAFPGLVALRVAPNLLAQAVRRLPRGVVLVVGSNGKSTTTHMISELLRHHGLRVFTNPTGANLPQGLASSLVRQVGASGIIQGDIAVLEVDEAFAVTLAEMLQPRIVVGLNTQVDQLSRYIETERAGAMMLDAMILAQEAIVTNRDDPYMSTVGEHMQAARSSSSPRVVSFGVSADVINESPSGLLNAENFSSRSSGPPQAGALDQAGAEVTALTSKGAQLSTGGGLLDVTLPARGLHYAVDAAAAVATCQQVLGKSWSSDKTLQAFLAMKPAFGRGEVLPFGHTSVTFVMFKNLASLQLNLDALPADLGPVMLAIDEGTADMSWIYDANFHALTHVDVISGAKCWQIATCLTMKGVTFDRVEPQIEKAVAHLRTISENRVAQTWIVNYEVTMIARSLIGFTELETSA